MTSTWKLLIIIYIWSTLKFIPKYRSSSDLKNYFDNFVLYGEFNFKLKLKCVCSYLYVTSIVKTHTHIGKPSQSRNRKKPTQMLNSWSKMEASFCWIKARVVKTKTKQTKKPSFAKIQKCSVQLILWFDLCLVFEAYFSHCWYLKCEVQCYSELGQESLDMETKQHQYPLHFSSLVNDLCLHPWGNTSGDLLVHFGCGMEWRLIALLIKSGDW